MLASDDWLGRDGDGNELLQLGDWQLSDLVDPSAWPAQFRLEDFDDELTGSNKADDLDGGAGADDLCDGRAEAGTGSASPERGQHLVLVFLGAGGGFGPRRAAYAVGERRRRLGD